MVVLLQYVLATG